MKTTKELLTGGTLRSLFEKTQALNALNATWTQIGKEEWTAHSSVADFEAGLLTLVVTNSAWATRIRFAIPEIMRLLERHEDFMDLKQIQVKILQQSTKQAQEQTSLEYPDINQLLDETAKSISCEALRNSLMKLATRFK